jgi:hypothetical protein
MTATRTYWQSARQPYFSKKNEIGRDWHRSQTGQSLGGKVKICTPVHGLSDSSAIEQIQSPCTGVHIFTFAPQSHPIWLLHQSRPICLNKVVAPTDWEFSHSLKCAAFKRSLELCMNSRNPTARHRTACPGYLRIGRTRHPRRRGGCRR